MGVSIRMALLFQPQMHSRRIYISLLVLTSIGFYLLGSYTHQSGPKCPDDYAKDEAGSTRYQADLTNWENDFYIKYPKATFQAWAEARYQFWVDNNCVEALRRYKEAKNDKAESTSTRAITDTIQKAINNHTL